MRIHFPNHPAPTPDAWAKTPRDFAIAALKECQAAGTIAPHVRFKTLETKQRRGTGSALEVQLKATQRDRGRRGGNSGSYGMMSGDIYGATYDEWGFFLAALYRLAGEDIICGTPKSPTYSDAHDFRFKTGHTYDADYPEYVEKWGDDYPYRFGKSQIGRRGAGRTYHDDPYTRYATEDPRTPEFLRQLHAGEVF